jgi:hypothetical protein
MVMIGAGMISICLFHDEVEDCDVYDGHIMNPLETNISNESELSFFLFMSLSLCSRRQEGGYRTAGRRMKMGK